jgi:hypothetical protein
MDPRQLLSRLAQLKAEGDQIMQQLISSGMPPEQIMAAVEGGGQPGGPPPGLGADRGPGLPTPSGADAMREYQAVAGQGSPRGLLATA